MRVLGVCPMCESLDSIVEVVSGPRWPHHIICLRCNQVWKDAWNLVREEQSNGRNLILVDIQTNRRHVTLELPYKNEVPWADTVITVLNAALLTKYSRLRPCFATEGGVEGRVGWSIVEFRNDYEHIGLSSDYDFHLHYPSPQPTDWVLRFYERLLTAVFARRLRYRRQEVRPGAILWLPAEGSDNHIEAWKLLSLALRTVGGPRMPEKVLAVLRQERGSLFGGLAHLRGLTDEEIVKIFVPPPGMEEFFKRRES